MDRLNHWRYLLSLEKEFTETLRYVEFTPSQESVYSFEFTRLLILICSELDVLLKVVCDSACPKGKPGTIGEYFPCIAGKYQIQLEAGGYVRIVCGSGSILAGHLPEQRGISWTNRAFSSFSRSWRG